MASPVRVAIYYAPLSDDPLTHASSAWLGRDPATNAPVAQPLVDRIAEITAEPRLYGFHATVKPPMRLAEGTDWAGFMTAVRTAAADLAPFDLPPLAVADVYGFLALRETKPCPALQGLPMRAWNGLIHSVRLRPRMRWRGGGWRNCRLNRMRCWCAGAIPTCSAHGSFT